MRRTLFVLAATFFLMASMTTDAMGESSARPARHDDRGPRGAGVEEVTLLRVHGGFSMPSGDFGDGFDTGLGIGANIAYGVSRSVLISGGFAFHHFDGDGFDGDASIMPITFNAECVLSDGRTRPWVGGGIGFYNIEVDTGPIVIPPYVFSGSVDETNFGINLGGGVSWGSGGKGVWGAGMRFHHVFEGDVFDDLDFATLQIGYGFYL